MNIYNLCRSIVKYYDSTRAVGHTKATLGDSRDALFVGVTREHARNLVGDSGAIPASIAEIENGLLVGYGSRPILFDNHTLRYIFDHIASGSIAREMEFLRKSIHDQQLDLDALNDSLTLAQYNAAWYAVEYGKVPRWLRWVLRMKHVQKGGRS